MNRPSQWMLYGANGYTGRLIAEEAVRREMKPVLAGRSAEAIRSVAAELDCPSRVFGLGDVASISAQLAGVKAVLHCAGPFSATAEPMIEACLAAGVHYLDVTGEIPVIEAAAAKHGRALEAGVTIIPAVGFDVVPSDCLAAMLARRVPEATHLILAFAGAGRVSPGTAKTMLEGLPQGGRVRVDGRITKVPTAWKTMKVPFRDGTRSAVTIPWGDVASAWHSTGIPNIEVYLAMPPGQIRALRLARPMLPLLRLPLPQSLLRAGLRRFLADPSAGKKGDAHRGSFWGRVQDAKGNFAEATLQTPDAYRLTALTALASLEKVLAQEAPPGFSTPSQAFGPEFILTIPDTDLRWETDSPSI
ncbi:MAG: saccharopine dehydrogenase NADP-binding domain-containing protein [Planctomycetota bacterium]